MIRIPSRCGQSASRSGLTLVEVLVALGIFALVIGLSLAGVQRVREAAVRMQSVDNLRQIGIALHSLAAEKTSSIGNLSDAHAPKKALYSEASLFWYIVPYVHGRQELRLKPSTLESEDYFDPKVRCFRSPGDPTWDVDPVYSRLPNRCSYVYNIAAVDRVYSLPFAFPDGTSQTIAFAEHYFLSQRTHIALGFYRVWPGDPAGHGPSERRATFADAGWFDVLPVKDPVSGKTVPSVPGRTFQVRPTPEEADGYTPQTPFAAGLPILLFDGSVRTVSPGVDPSLFWSLVTPAGGEVIGDY